MNDEGPGSNTDVRAAVDEITHPNHDRVRLRDRLLTRDTM